MYRIYTLSFCLFLLSFTSCKNENQSDSKPNVLNKENFNVDSFDFIVAFGSCNKQNFKQPLWKSIADQNPDIFVWGGDNIYADTEDMNKMAEAYKTQINNPEYAEFLEKMNENIHGTWDDHDYGKNDAGVEWMQKAKSQKLFLDFMGVDSMDVRRDRKGIYYAETFDIHEKTLKLIILDTRYFRSSLQEDSKTKKRYKPWQNGEGTLLGEAQWKWFEELLQNSKSDYHIIVSSIQVWSDEHGFETWGNFPHEVDKLKNMLNKHQPNNLILLSGDRHISEFSSQEIQNYDYPVFDFTSSGLTHAYSKFISEPNEDRVGKVVATESFGVLKYNFENEELLLEMRNTEGVLQSYELQF